MSLSFPRLDIPLMSEYLEVVKPKSSPVHAEGDMSIWTGGPAGCSRQLHNPSLLHFL